MFAAYEKACKRWAENVSKRPTVIVQPVTVEDVIASVRAVAVFFVRFLRMGYQFWLVEVFDGAQWPWFPAVDPSSSSQQ